MRRPFKGHEVGYLWLLLLVDICGVFVHQNNVCPTIAWPRYTWWLPRLLHNDVLIILWWEKPACSTNVLQVIWSGRQVCVCVMQVNAAKQYHAQGKNTESDANIWGISMKLVRLSLASCTMSHKLHFTFFTPMSSELPQFPMLFIFQMMATASMARQWENK